MQPSSLIIATNNSHKCKEIQAAIGLEFDLKTLEEIGFHDEIPETGNTLKENASLKSHYIYERYQKNCFADDTGLEIESLNGEPGVYSARYAGVNKNHEENIDLVLKKMNGKENRNARFRTIISLIFDGKEYLFEGILNGKIRHERSGDQGFGYDPIFEPEGYTCTLGEMSLEDKNRISHRGKAIQALATFLKGL